MIGIDCAQSELEVARSVRGMGTAVGSSGRQQAGISPQVLPGRLIQRRVSADEVTDHLPGSNVEGPFRRRPHGKGNGALRAETDPLRRGLLPRSDADGLGKHVDRNRFVSCLEFLITAKTAQVVQWRSPGPVCGHGDILSTSWRGASTQEDSGEAEVDQRTGRTDGKVVNLGNPRIDELNRNISEVRRVAGCQRGMLGEGYAGDHSIAQIARAVLLVPRCH